MLKDEALVSSGISAASSMRIGLLANGEVDGYIAESQLRRFIKEHALSPAGIEGNVRLRVVADPVWKPLAGRPAAPLAAVALDLADEADPRTEAAGRKLARQIDRRYQRPAKGR
ncbi:MAG TPA: hypothetical protein VK480_07375 [Solirubrobacterales bacterium]|nr:hypothetical protein [Solirubrobacterales bacterium]